MFRKSNAHKEMFRHKRFSDVIIIVVVFQSHVEFNVLVYTQVKNLIRQYLEVIYLSFWCSAMQTTATLATGTWQLQNDSAPIHSSHLIQTPLVKSNITLVCLAVYSPSMAPCNVWLFSWKCFWKEPDLSQEKRLWGARLPSCTLFPRGLHESHPTMMWPLREVCAVQTRIICKGLWFQIVFFHNIMLFYFPENLLLFKLKNKQTNRAPIGK